MRKSSVLAPMVLLLAVVALVSVPAPVANVAGSVAVVAAPLPQSHVGLASADVTPASPAPQTTYPRTVLVETFTGVWCPHCPAETQALWNIDHSTPRNLIDIAELHVCAFPAGSGPCDENYVPPDGTSDARGSFYGVSGFPTVFFDGLHAQVGAGNSGAQMEGIYNESIANASAIPGNVSISQVATVAYGNVTEHANITSGITGTYNAITYLVESINKQNLSLDGSGPHDLGDVVRATLHNAPVNLVAGQTTEFNVTAPLNTTWKQQNLSVVTFVQQNSTKIIENANMAPASQMATGIRVGAPTVSGFLNTSVTVHVANLSTGNPVFGATVTLSATADGTFTSNDGATASNGTFTTTFVAPDVTSVVPVEITAEASSGTLVGYAETTVTVDPLLPPTAPTGFSITPGLWNVTLNWTSPSTGAGGVTYDVFQSTSQSGSFSLLATVTGTSYEVTGLLAGQSYWYEVDAADAAGFSSNSTAMSASSATATAQGLPLGVGWWLAIDSENFTSPTGAPMTVYLPDGTFAYTYGPYGNAVLAGTPTAPLAISGTAVTFNALFTPNFATLQATVSPSDATVTLNGSAVPVYGGGVFEKVLAGTYTLQVSSPGYQTVNQSVVLTPGNTTLVPQIQLVPSASTGSGGSTGSASGVSMSELLELGAGAAVAAVVTFAAIALLVSKSRRGGTPPRSNGPGPSA